MNTYLYMLCIHSLPEPRTNKGYNEQTLIKVNSLYLPVCLFICLISLPIYLFTPLSMGKYSNIPTTRQDISVMRA